jgi:hypothetical protein
VTSTGRIATAFAVSASASTLTMVAILSVIGRGIPSARYIVTVAAIVYGATIVLGIPAFLLSRGWHLHSVAFYAGAALVVAAPLMTVAAALTGGAVLPLVAGLSAATGGVVFHEVMEQRPNYR